MPADFYPVAITHGLLFDLRDGEHPSRVFGVDRAALSLADDDTHFCLITDGQVTVVRDRDRFTLRPGAFCVVPGAGTLDGTTGRSLVISRLGYRGLFQIGGPLEAGGRLRYIDGCSDTLLVCPPRLGEPCLNHLHIPPRTHQSSHSHPSERIGVIAAGSGTCITDQGHYPLSPGMAWRIPAGSRHCFVTSDQPLDVLAWHPDTDFGPTDENHPMLNRTFLRPATPTLRA
ncbi:MAG TPA: cupin domain-containing protein [Pseudomonadota bacterium]|nr:cupin domain-containing protein [Pseudomonadota bacterium]